MLIPSESQTIADLYDRLLSCSARTFPEARTPWNVPDTHGVYVIYDANGVVVHVGRTTRGKAGLSQRLYDHVIGSSSFAWDYLNGAGSKLRGTHRFKYLEVPDARRRALLEAYAIGHLCPQHLGLGGLRAEKPK